MKLAALLFLAAPLLATPSVRYSLSFPHAVHHEAEVLARFEGVESPELTVVMSRSSPGRYALHEFAKNVYSVRATDSAGKALAVTHPDPYSWRIPVPADRTVSFEYTLFGNHADGTYNGIDATHAHLNMPATLVWGKGFEQAPAVVHFNLTNRDWKVATQMLPRSDGDWSAPNLEWLMDCPVEISNYWMSEWKTEDAVFRLSLHHTGTREQAERYARLCQAVVLEEEGVFGALPKYDGGSYTFLIDYLPYVARDGMEHRDSTFITDTGSLENGAASLIGAVSHEFFHSWNVRRIRPRSLEPFDFEQANMSGELWFAEGFTNYYGVLTLQRAGISPLTSFTKSMGGAVNQVVNAPGRRIHSAVEMSELAPFVDAATSIDPTNFENTYISYYTYGQALAFGIDLAIRERFTGKSLDDWMREVWRRHPDIEKPYSNSDLQDALEAAVGDRSFAEEIFRHYILGRQSMDYAALVESAGMMLRKVNEGAAWLGKVDGATVMAEPQLDTPAYAAGVSKGDTILEIDGKTVKADSSMKDQLSRRHPGDRIRLKVRTRAGEREVQVRLGEDPRLELVTFEQAGRSASPAALAFRQAWLGSKALHTLPDIK